MSYSRITPLGWSGSCHSRITLLWLVFSWRMANTSEGAAKETGEITAFVSSRCGSSMMSSLCSKEIILQWSPIHTEILVRTALNYQEINEIRHKIDSWPIPYPSANFRNNLASRFCVILFIGWAQSIQLKTGDLHLLLSLNVHWCKWWC